MSKSCTRGLGQRPFPAPGDGDVRGAALDDPDARGRSAPRGDRARRCREDPVHVGLDGDAEGRHQHAPHDLQQPADDPADAALSRRRAAGARRLAALASHLRRQPQRGHRGLQRRVALSRRRASRCRRLRRERAQPAGGGADGLPERAERLRRAGAAHSAATRRLRRSSSAACRSSSTPPPASRSTSPTSCSGSRSRPAASGWSSSPASARPRRRRWPSAGRGRASSRLPSACRCRESRPSWFRSAPGQGRAGVAARPRRATRERKLEIRVRGPNVTPGYWRQDALTREAFDEEGFYCMGDAARLVDPQDLVEGARVRRTHQGRFQAVDRHLGQRRPAARADPHALRALRARRGDRRARSRRGRHARRARRRRLPDALFRPCRIGPGLSGDRTCGRSPALARAAGHVRGRLPRAVRRASAARSS